MWRARVGWGDRVLLFVYTASLWLSMRSVFLFPLKTCLDSGRVFRLEEKQKSYKLFFCQLANALINQHGYKKR
jgi:hypothetical protein